MPDDPLHLAIASVPPGPWAVGVSGGADSVSLALLLRERADLRLHVAHLDHQLRGQHSEQDAAFVAELAARWQLPCTIARRQELEPQLAGLPANPSARYRAMRLALFRRVVQEQKLAGVILAHHADDQAETILHRLLRGSGPAGLGGMSGDATISGLRVLRPLLAVRRQFLRDYLKEASQTWREDESNTSPKYLRNRLRQALADRSELVASLLAIGTAMADLNRWAGEASPRLASTFNLTQLADLPSTLAEAAARRWLAQAGCPPQLIQPATIEQLRAMAADAATPARQHFPGGVIVRRRSGKISAPAETP